MKIGIDIRICEDSGYYSQYVEELVSFFCKLQNNTNIVLFISKNQIFSDNITSLSYVTTKAISGKRDSFSGKKLTKKAIDEEKLGYVLFFDEAVPSGLKTDYYLVLQNLKEVFFPKKELFHRLFYTKQLTRIINASKKVLVLDGGTALELNERLNIPENLIGIIHGFFPTIEASRETNKIDVHLKHNLRGKYLIYDSGNEVHNNFERILKSVHKLKQENIILYIIILCDATVSDLDIRKLSIDFGISDQILFLGSVEKKTERSYYEQSLGVIFSSIYESFPFSFSKAISYGSVIFANDIPANKATMQETIEYLDPLSVHNMTHVIQDHIESPTVANYEDITNILNPEKSAKELIYFTQI